MDIGGPPRVRPPLGSGPPSGPAPPRVPPPPRDVNECHDESLCANGRCVNTEGSFYCNCDRPWTPDAHSKKCEIATVADVNECEDPANCGHGHCVDTPGSYYCICSPPWTLAIDRNSCMTPEEQADVNECQDPSYCKNGRCENTPGSFHCFCDPPLTFSAALKQCVYDDRTAAHKDVCFLRVDEGLICSEPRNGMVVTYSECCCHYGRGWGPECNTCPPRHSEMFSRLCEMHLETESDGEQDFLAAFANYNPDIDECAEPGARASPCKNARCVNTTGSYKCYCKHGFVATRRPNTCVRRRTRPLEERLSGSGGLGCLLLGKPSARHSAGLRRRSVASPQHQHHLRLQPLHHLLHLLLPPAPPAPPASSARASLRLCEANRVAAQRGRTHKDEL
ncbi:Latent-transforming growth factor beta-binding protein 3 [Liparis tanakae]|uniref:Latent-transforming growth factor beta-binding protein 3 n=1 Tax=Liparis tanakae TaxID=230148 RepID=A0A4Z2H4X1_9TELE|nr:Latent-transforming growth factor beta-binding protein 3 [Liparis tanakae]